MLPLPTMAQRILLMALASVEAHRHGAEAIELGGDHVARQRRRMQRAASRS